MTNFDISKMSQTIFHRDHEILQQTQSTSPKCQRSVSINTATNVRSINEYKQRSKTMSHGIDQVVGFLQRKFSRIPDEEKQEFDDLKRIK